MGQPNNFGCYAGESVLSRERSSSDVRIDPDDSLKGEPSRVTEIVLQEYKEE